MSFYCRKILSTGEENHIMNIRRERGARINCVTFYCSHRWAWIHIDFIVSNLYFFPSGSVLRCRVRDQAEPGEVVFETSPGARPSSRCSGWRPRCGRPRPRPGCTGARWRRSAAWRGTGRRVALNDLQRQEFAYKRVSSATRVRINCVTGKPEFTLIFNFTNPYFFPQDLHVADTEPEGGVTSEFRNCLRTLIGFTPIANIGPDINQWLRRTTIIKWYHPEDKVL